MAQTNINVKNRRALFDYEVLERCIAGIQLAGTEIKSIRAGHVSLVDSFCYYNRNELWVKGIRIAEYFYGSYNNHIPNRDRKLLLKRKELNKWQIKVKESGLSIIPLRLFVNEKGLAKLELALAQGKKQYDKRETLRAKDAQRDMDRVTKRF